MEFRNDLYNVLSNLMFEYSQKGICISKEDFENEIRVFTQKFYDNE